MKDMKEKVVAPELETKQEEKPVVKEVISQQQIDEWKETYGKIYKSYIGDDTFIFRKLRRKEYVIAMSTEATADAVGDKIYARQDIIAAMATLYPEGIEALISENGGLGTTLSDEIISKSGFDMSITQEL